MNVALAMTAALLAIAPLAASGQRADTSPAADGQVAFRRYCGGCHLTQGFGTRTLARRVPAEQAKLEDRRDLTAEYVRMAVRHGLGSMPPIRRSELDDTTLASVGAYLEKSK